MMSQPKHPRRAAQESEAPATTAAITVGFAEGVTDGQASVGEPGVRLTVSVPLETLTAIDWGDGQTDSPPDTTGGFVAHVYRSPASGVAVTVTDQTDATGTSPTFDVAESDSTTDPDPEVPEVPDEDTNQPVSRQARYATYEKIEEPDPDAKPPGGPLHKQELGVATSSE